MTDPCGSIKAWPSRPTGRQLWRAVLAPKLSVGLAEIVIGPAIAASLCLCPFLLSFPPLQCWPPGNSLINVLYTKLFSESTTWGIQSVIAIRNIYVSWRAAPSITVSASKTCVRERKQRTSSKHFIDMTWQLHHFYSNIIGKTYSHIHL